MKKKTQITYFVEKVIHSKNPDLEPHEKILVPIPAVYIEDSPPICDICHEPEEGHARRRRVHSYKPMADPGITIDLNFPGQPVSRITHVQHGETANCWADKRAGD